VWKRKGGMIMTDKFQIIIDAGHGGSDNGASSNGFIEKHLNLQVSLVIESKLRKYFKHISMTRTKDIDVTLSQRGVFVSQRASEFKGRTICLSVHFNAFNGVARGVETIHSIFSKPDLAESILSSILELGIPKRRVFSKKSTKGNFDFYAMHRLTGKAETVIVEPLFLDNKEDQEFLRQPDFLDKLADKYIEGLLKHLNIPITPTKQEEPIKKEELKVSENKENAPKTAQWKIDLLKNSHNEGLIAEFDRWVDKLDEKVDLWVVLALMNHLYNKLKEKESGK
jgi:N-acetylmuramoyl-L-alanine amidase